LQVPLGPESADILQIATFAKQIREKEAAAA
jgi:hypothetical protein